MILTLSGAAVFVLCLFLLNACRPKPSGQPALMRVPWIESSLPLLVTCLCALGVAMIIGGMLGR